MMARKPKPPGVFGTQVRSPGLTADVIHAAIKAAVSACQKRAAYDRKKARKLRERESNAARVATA